MLNLLPSPDVAGMTVVVIPAGKGIASDAALVEAVIVFLMAYKSVSGGFGTGVLPPSRRQ